MSEMYIEKNVIITDESAMLDAIRLLTGKKIRDLGAFKKFTTTEANTHFYLDNRMNCKMENTSDAVYLWLDTGYLDKSGRAIFVSLLKNQSLFEGHIVGNASYLATSISNFFSYNAKQIKRNVDVFFGKYSNKITCRRYKHITEDNEYLIKSCNDESADNIMAMALKGLDYEFPEAGEPMEEIVEPAVQEDNQESIIEEEMKGFTIGLLVDKIDEMESYIEELLTKIDELNSKYDARDKDIEDLRQRNEDYKKAFVQIRTYMADEETEINRRLQEQDAEECKGHILLGSGKILVVGAAGIDENIMKGIAKTYGFVNEDIEFMTDYNKLVGVAGNIQSRNRYKAVVFGACPHKTSGTGKSGNFIDEMREKHPDWICMDARSKSGKLKVTKTSFREAIIGVVESLEKKVAG